MDILSKNNAVPLYEQLKLSLRKQIDQRILPEGAQLPTEAELCKAYNVSRITIRRAV